MQYQSNYASRAREYFACRRRFTNKAVLYRLISRTEQKPNNKIYAKQQRTMTGARTREKHARTHPSVSQRLSRIFLINKYYN